MSAPVSIDQPHNIAALFIGTGEFQFSKGATSVADAFLKGWRDFGNMVSVTPNVDSQREDHFGSYRGIRRKDKSIATQNKLEYSMKFDQLDKNILQYALGCTDTTDYTQTVKTAAAFDALVFSAPAPSDINKWYSIKVAGVPVRGITDLVLTTLTEGTDYEVDVKLGKVRFILVKTATVNGTVTAPAITAADPLFQEGMAPLQDLNATGYGHLILYDQNDTTKVAMEHRDFSCEIAVESFGEINGQNFTEVTIKATVTDVPGNIYVRRVNSLIAAT